MQTVTRAQIQEKRNKEWGMRNTFSGAQHAGPNHLHDAADSVDIMPYTCTSTKLTSIRVPYKPRSAS